MVRWNMAGMFPFFVGWISMKTSIDLWDFPAMVPGGWTCISGVARGTGAFFFAGWAITCSDFFDHMQT
jgi:hypothetical protein